MPVSNPDMASSGQHLEPDAADQHLLRSMCSDGSIHVQPPRADCCLTPANALPLDILAGQGLLNARLATQPGWCDCSICNQPAPRSAVPGAVTVCKTCYVMQHCH